MPARVSWASRMMKKRHWEMVTNDINHVDNLPEPHTNSPQQHNTNSPSPSSPTSSANTSTNSVANCPYLLRHPRREVANQLTTPRHHPQEFQGTNLNSLNPGLSAGLAEPLTPPYTIANNQVCKYYDHNTFDFISYSV
ncbi:unnamed protein product [Anisakis simplex]|uniref:Uncharacterized protein n=1 Tax=Anisakis simplex TaxID=6269 RepID=A0A0M3JCS3_ANISI|nr:unnamed protein product [Anisakis simplex]